MKKHLKKITTTTFIISVVIAIVPIICWIHVATTIVEISLFETMFIEGSTDGERFVAWAIFVLLVLPFVSFVCIRNQYYKIALVGNMITVLTVITLVVWALRLK